MISQNTVFLQLETVPQQTQTRSKTATKFKTGQLCNVVRQRNARKNTMLLIKITAC